MHEMHPGVQDMACDTFLKISQKCRRKFVVVQVGESIPFIDEILGNLNITIADLTPSQIHTFYEAVGYMISSHTDAELRDALIVKLMNLPNMTVSVMRPHPMALNAYILLFFF
jgi:exportin-1